MTTEVEAPRRRPTPEEMDALLSVSGKVVPRLEELGLC